MYDCVHYSSNYVVNDSVSLSSPEWLDTYVSLTPSPMFVHTSQKLTCFWKLSAIPSPVGSLLMKVTESCQKV